MRYEPTAAQAHKESGADVNFLQTVHDDIHRNSQERFQIFLVADFSALTVSKGLCIYYVIIIFTLLSPIPSCSLLFLPLY